jgi:putative transposase
MGLANEDLDSWPQVDPSAFSGDDCETSEEVFIRRSTAVRMYARSEPLRAIFDATAIPKQSLYRLVDRCLAKDADGRIAGFRGLILYRHLSENRLNESGKLVGHNPKPGSLLALFARYPLIRELIFNYTVLGKLQGLKQKEIDPPIVAIHAEFLRLCEAAGIKSPHYPFNSASLAKPALRRWVKAERLRHQLSYLNSSNPEAAKMATARAPDVTDAQCVSRCYQRVECDGHRIDFHGTIELPSPTCDGVILARISRVWIIVLIEIMSGAILGYSISFGTNYSSVDVMRAVKNSLLPWKRRKLTVKTIEYRDGDGFPSGEIAGLSYACFDELCLDNAKSHLSRHFLNYLDRTVAAVPVFSPKATPNAHPYVEGFFNLLEEAGIHRMAGTTGSNIGDVRNQKTKNLQYEMSYDLLADMVELLITRINGSNAPNSSISRLEILRRAVIRRTAIIRRIPESLRDEVLRYDMYEEGAIGKDHQRPVVRFHGARYSSDVLASAFLLIGRKVLLQANSENLQSIECTLDDGTSLGILMVERRWRYTRHGLITRQQANRLINEGTLHDDEDIPRAFRRHIEIEAKRSKRAASQLKRIQLEQDCTVSESTTLSEAKSAEREFNSEQSIVQSDTAQSEESAYEEAEALLRKIGAQYR